MKTTHYQPPFGDKYMLLVARNKLLLPMYRHLSYINILNRDQNKHLYVLVWFTQEQNVLSGQLPNH